MNEETRDLKDHCDCLIEELTTRIKMLEYRVDELEKKADQEVK
jgi:hypothetical protein